MANHVAVGDIVGALDSSKNTNAIAERLARKTADAKSWSDKAPKAGLESPKTEQHKCYARFFVSGLRADLRPRHAGGARSHRLVELHTRPHMSVRSRHRGRENELKQLETVL